MNVARRYEATRRLRVHQYWTELHNRKRIVAAIEALNEGQTQERVAQIMGVSHSTLIRNGIMKGADPKRATWNIVRGETRGQRARLRGYVKFRV